MATGSLSDTIKIYPGWYAFPLWNGRVLFLEEEALRHHSHLLLKLFPGLSFKNGSGWHFQSIWGLSGYLNYRPPEEYLFLGVFFHLVDWLAVV